MLNALLNAEQTRFAEFGEVSLYAFIGFLVVFAGIGFLILIVWTVGKILSSQNQKVKVDTTVKQETIKEENVSEGLAIADASADDLSEETIAVITAAIMAYYEKTNPKCEFTVKRIKRIKTF